MDALTLSRLQFGSTIIYHFLFVPLTMGLVLLVAVMETLYVRSGNTTYKRMAQFWGKLFLINFALGVVTGIVQEFQFGMNWSAYSRFIGDVFGAPLAIEALLAFFMESTFLGIWIFGWDQLPKKLHLAMIWMVVLGSHLSAFWILVANSFMQEPVGYAIHNGRAEMTNFFALLSNPNLWFQFPHVAAGGAVTGAFFVVGISAYQLLRNKSDQDLFQRSLKIGMIAALIASITVATIGHFQGQYVVQHQPMKMAAAEALWDSESPASFSLITIGNEKLRTDVFAIKVPYLLSFLSYNNFTGEVQGINQLQAQYVKQYGPGNYVPPVAVTYWGFRAMFIMGTLMALLATVGTFLMYKRWLNRPQFRWFLWVMVGAIALPYIANTGGWILTEIGRQPWLVNGVLRTQDGVSPSVGAGSILFTLITFILLYGVLAVVDAFLLTKYARKGVEPVQEKVETEELVVTY
ncbi:cytochrome ubiquinol oxidase subunit I [Tengunoibacter tsumagoiensis]|uniref:Cytochrome ubiquinol oxidase subunit I n=1 Tax=Tengunoibacter tsumagoiensis TaxID=2014871 RepID=A0A401ZVZ6_9CHLR|nr:cytochrome ubiquinol oxidase subunit I [Tengunoibacter tsumagoiensis]GCE10976.1 cytochrome ubiquinol oxidase subunit I [Tengunoibacter tsumagoiensis]